MLEVALAFLLSTAECCRFKHRAAQIQLGVSDTLSECMGHGEERVTSQGGQEMQEMLGEGKQAGLGYTVKCGKRRRPH